MDGGGSATPPPYGMPRPLIAKQLVSLTGDRHLLVHSYLLETAVCLGTMGDLHQTIDWSLAETVSKSPCAQMLEVMAIFQSAIPFLTQIYLF